MKHVHISLVLV